MHCKCSSVMFIILHISGPTLIIQKFGAGKIAFKNPKKN